MTAPDLAPFESLAALRQEHLRLLRQARAAGGTPTGPEDLEPFLDRAEALGTRLDAAADREAAQGILDYWTAALLTAAGTERPRQAPPRALADFDAGTVHAAAADAERAVAALGPDDQELARRLLLRLVRLTPDGTFEPVAVRRADLEAVGNPDRVAPVRAALEKAGVLRMTDDPDGPTYALRFEALTRAWPRYATWLDKRARFRDQVRYWEKNDRGRGALISGPLLTDALAYYDLSGTEKAYLDQSRQKESRQKHLWQWAAVVAVFLMLFAIAMWVRAQRKSAEAERERQNAQDAQRQAERALEREQKAQVDLAKEMLSGAKKEVLQSMNGLVQSLARATLAGDNAAERDRAERRWKSTMGRTGDLLRDLHAAEKRAGELKIVGSPNTQLLKTVELLYQDFDKVRIDDQSGSPRDLALKPLKLGQNVKAELTRRHDEVINGELVRMQRTAFDYAVSSTAAIVDRVRMRDYWTASQYIKEFWVQYWGEMGLLEGPRVESAMKEFGDQLDEIDKLFREWSGWKETKMETKKGPPLPFWQQNLKMVKGAPYKDDPEYEKKFQKLLQALEERKKALDAALEAERGKIGEAAPLTAY